MESLTQSLRPAAIAGSRADRGLDAVRPHTHKSGAVVASGKVYPGYPHGICTTDAETINADLLKFVRA